MSIKPVFNFIRVIPRDEAFLNRRRGSRGEIFYDRESNSLRLFDGETIGGSELALDDLSNVSNSNFLAKAQSAGVGSGGSGAPLELNELTDVDIENPTTGQVLKYNGEFWVNDADNTSEGQSVDNFSTILVDGQPTITANTINDQLTLVAGSNITIETDSNNKSITITSTATSGGGSTANSFANISISGQDTIVADSDDDTLTLVAGTGIQLTTNAATDSITISSTVSSGVSNFVGLADAVAASLTIDKIYLPAITMLVVNNVGATAYTFDQYSGNNPTIFALAGATIAFNLNIGGHPFLIQDPTGTNYNIGLTHVTTSGVVTTGADAQGKTSGTLYWKPPESISGNYRYQCSIHAGMFGVITVKRLSII